MHAFPTTIDLASLQRAEDRFRKKLQSQPDNTSTRLNLAWCLFMQAEHCSGKESVLPLASEHLPDALNPDVNTESHRNSQSLLHEFLGHICIAKNLCIHKSDFMDASRLQTLVNLSGLQDAARQVEDQSTERLYRLSWEIMHGDVEGDRDQPSD